VVSDAYEGRKAEEIKEDVKERRRSKRIDAYECLMYDCLNVFFYIVVSYVLNLARFITPFQVTLERENF